MLLFTSLLVVNCNGALDFSGFIQSTDRVDTRYTESQAWNITHPFKNIVVNSENYQLLIAGDAHIGGVTNFNFFMKQANMPDISAAVLVGDMVTGKKEDFTTLKTILDENSEVQSFLLVGNHCLYFDGWQSFKDYFGTSVYYFTVQTTSHKDIYICLDSGGGTLGGRQLAWLKNLLETKRLNYRNCVVFSHVNFFRNRHTGSTNPLVTELYVLMDLFLKYKVDYIISGHDHVRSINNFGLCTYITLDALKDDISNASYLKFSVSGSKMSYNFQSIN